MTLIARMFVLVAGRNPDADRRLDETRRQAIPRNFLLFVASHLLTKLGDALSNPKTTLTWLAGALGVPSWITAMLVPLRESGSMLLQIWVAGAVQRFAQRKWAWSLGSAVQALSLFGMAASALVLHGAAGGIALLVLLAVFALARSISSVASKDVLGRTLPPGRRGTATGWAASAAGLATLALGVTAVLVMGPNPFGASGYALLLAGAGMLWVLAGAIFLAMREPPEEGGSHDSGVRLRLLFKDAPLRRFVVARALLMCTALSAPYYVMLAQRELGHASALLAAFVVAEGAAGMLGGPVWGRLADRSSRRVMAIGGSIGGVLGAALAVVAAFSPGLLSPPWLLPLLYFVLSLAHQAVRIGRKTYVVDMAEGALRTDYVAVSNSALGVLLLVVGGITAALSALSLSLTLGTLAAMGLLGALLSVRLPTVGAERD